LNGIFSNSPNLKFIDGFPTKFAAVKMEFIKLLDGLPASFIRGAIVGEDGKTNASHSS
jgi:hypothetical protein